MRNWHLHSIKNEICYRYFMSVGHYLWGIDTGFFVALTTDAAGASRTLPMRNWHIIHWCFHYFSPSSTRRTLPMRNWHISPIFGISNLTCRTLPMRNWHFLSHSFIRLLFSSSSDITYEELTPPARLALNNTSSRSASGRTLPMRNWHQYLDFLNSISCCRTLPMRNWHIPKRK